MSEDKKGSVSPTASECGSTVSTASRVTFRTPKLSSARLRSCCDSSASKTSGSTPVSKSSSSSGGGGNSTILTQNTDDFIIGQRVWVGGTKAGQIAYIGETQFAPGEWAGVVLDDPIGKNDGSVAGVRYFQCEPKRGVFSRLTRLTTLPLQQTDADEVVRRLMTTPSRLNSSSSIGASNLSLASISSTNTTHINELKIGERVIVRSSAVTGSKAGILRYIGATEFASGVWCGVELDDPIGKNDGSVDGIRYFECLPMYGLFVLASKVSKSPSKLSYGPCQVHPLKRSNSRESMTSMVSSLASSMRTTSSKLASPKVKVPSSLATKGSLQEALKEKQLEMNRLMKERKLERAEITRAAEQADKMEQQLNLLKNEYQLHRRECEAVIRQKDNELQNIQPEKEKLLLQLDESKKKIEDLEFKFEELAAGQDNTEVWHIKRINELESSLEKEREKWKKVDDEMKQLLQNSETECFTLREQLATYQTSNNTESTQIKQLMTKNEDLMKQINQCQINCQNKIDEMKKEHGRKVEEVETLMERIKEEKEALHCEKITLTDANQRFIELKNETNEKVEELTKAKVDAENQLDLEKKQIAELSHITAMLKKDLEKEKLLVKTLNADKVKLLKADSTVAQLTENKERLMNEITEIQNRYHDEIEQLKYTNKKMNTELVAKLQQEKENLLKEQDSKIVSLNEVIERKDCELKVQFDQLELFKKEADKVKRITECYNQYKIKSENEIEIHKEKINLCNKELEKHTNKISELNNLIEETKKVLEKHATELDLKNQTIAKMEKINADQVQELEMLNNDLKQNLLTIEKLSGNKEKLEMNVEKSLQELKQIKQKNEELKNDLTCTEKLAEINEQHFDEAKQQLNINKNTINQMDEKIQTLNSSLNETTKILLEEQKKNIIAEQKQAQNDELIKKLNDKLQGLEEEASQYKNQLLNNESELVQLTKQLADSNDLLGSKNKQIDQMSSQLKENMVQLNNSNAEIVMITKKNADLTANMMEFEALLASSANTDEKLQQLNQEKQNILEQMRNIEQKLEKETGIVCLKNAEVKELTKKLINVEMKNREMTTELEAIKNSIKERESNLELLKENNEKERVAIFQKHELEMNNAMHLEKDLLIKINDLMIENNKLNQASQLYQTQLNILNDTIQKKSEETEKLKNQSKILQETIDKLKEKNHSLLKVQESTQIEQTQNYEEQLKQVNAEKQILELNSQKQNERIANLESDTVKIKSEYEVVSKKLSETLNEKEAEIKNMTSTLEQMTKQNVDNLEKLNQQRVENSALEQKIHHLQTTLTTEKERYEKDITQQQIDSEKTIQKLRETARIVEEKLSESQAFSAQTTIELTEKNQLIEKLTDQLKMNETQVLQLQQNEEKTRNVLEEKTKQLETSTIQLTKLNDEIISIKTELLNQEAETKKLKMEIITKDKEYRTLDEERKGRFLSQAFDFEKETAELKNALEIERKKLSVLQSSHASKDKEIELIKKSLAESNQKLDDLQRMNAKQEAKIKNINATTQTPLNSQTTNLLEKQVEIQSLNMKSTGMQTEINKLENYAHDDSNAVVSGDKVTLGKHNQPLLKIISNFDSLFKSNDLVDLKRALENYVEISCAATDQAKPIHKTEDKWKMRAKQAEAQVELLNLQIDKMRSTYAQADQQGNIDEETLISNKIPPLSNGANSALNSEELDQAHNQIEFLNSIIIDMHRKNDQLKFKIDALENKATGSSSLDFEPRRRLPAPRMFCDICDQFDLHETEDCPNQESEMEVQVDKIHHPPKNMPSIRVYCDICEIFDKHPTEECLNSDSF